MSDDSDRINAATVVSRLRDTGSSPDSSMSDGLGGLREVELVTEVLWPPLPMRAKRFLKGPIPWDQISVAARLGGTALAALLAVHHRTAITGRPDVTLPKGLLESLGMDRTAKARALRQLEAAGLCQVVRHPGRAAVIRLSNGTSIEGSRTRLPGGFVGPRRTR
jgi:hypothetical protein